MNYSGYDCPVCHKPFEDGQDVVVCPVCGAPHHRKCYQQKGGCGLEENHAKGIAWEDHVKGQRRSRPDPNQGYAHHSANSNEQSHTGGTATQRCPACGSINPPDGIFCQVCGTMMQRPAPNGFGGAAPFPGQQGGFNQQSAPGYSVPGYAPYGGMNPDEKIGDATVKEIATYVGPASNFYLSRFRLSARNGNRNMSFCWSGFLFNFMYFFYRKVYRVAIPLLIIFLFSLLPSFVYSYEYLRELTLQYGTATFPLPLITTPTLEKLALISNIAQMSQFAVSAIMGFTGHKLYLQDINRKIAAIKAREEGASTDQYIGTLAKEGGTSMVLPTILGIVLVVGYLAASVGIALLLNVNL